MITVLGATGRVGGRVTALLRERGETVRAVARSAGRLAGPGVEPWAGELTDVALLTAACTGADAVFVMTPADEGAVDHAAAHAARVDAVAAAVAAARVPYTVALSSLGADLAAGTGFVAGLHLLEQRLGAAADRLLLLRPGWFAENVGAALPVVRAEGVLVDSLDPDVALPVVAVRDVAAAAAEALLARRQTGVRELLGPADLTPAEQAAVLGRALGRPEIGYVRLPDEQMAGALVGAGFSAAAAAAHLGMTAALNEGRIRSLAGRSAATSTPTPFAAVVEELIA